MIQLKLKYGRMKKIVRTKTLSEKTFYFQMLMLDKVSNIKPKEFTTLL